MENIIKINFIEQAYYNPRKISSENFERLKESIKNHTKNIINWNPEDGFRLIEPVIINKYNNRLVGGHQRIKALLEIGQEWIHKNDIRYINEPDELKEKALNIKLNSEHLQGEYDYDLLEKIIFEYKDLNIELNEISIQIGLTEDFIDSILNNDTKIKEKELKPYKKFHLLLSYVEKDFIIINEILEKAKKAGIEIEQSSN